MLASMYADHIAPTTRLGRVVADDERLRAIFALLKDHKSADALLTGGSARDAVLGKVTNDTHILVRGLTPSAIAHYLTKSGKNVTIVGNGLIKSDDGLSIELPRMEAKKGHAAHHTISLQQDLAHRDFTVNALAYSLKDGILHDPWKGIQDISAKKLQTIGSPQQRFLKDPIRTLRLMRLAAELGFTIENNTWNTAIKNIPRLFATEQNEHGETTFKIPRAKVGAEITRALNANPLYGYQLLKKSGVLAETINLNDDQEKTEQKLAHLSDPHFLRLHGLKKASPNMIFATLFTHLEDAAENTLKKATALLHLHDIHKHNAHGFKPEHSAKILKNLRSLHVVHTLDAHEIANLLATDHASELLAVAHAHALAHPTENAFKERLHALRRQKEELQRVQPGKIIRGRDLISLKIPEGPHVRVLLKRVRAAQLHGDLTTKDEAMSFVKSLYNSLA